MSNSLYIPTGNPGAITRGASSVVRAEFQLIANALAQSPLVSEMVSAITSWVANVNANGFSLTGLGNAVNPADAANLQTVQALISGGGTPANIQITSLNKGTAAANQMYQANAAGTAVVPGLFSTDVQRAIRASRYARAVS